MSRDNKFRPGIHRKDEKLVMFRQGSVTVVRVRDEPAGWIKTSDRPFWRHCRPEIDLAMRVLLRRERRAVDEFHRFETGCSDKAELLPGCDTMALRRWKEFVQPDQECANARSRSRERPPGQLSYGSAWETLIRPGQRGIERLLGHVQSYPVGLTIVSFWNRMFHVTLSLTFVQLPDSSYRIRASTPDNLRSSVATAVEGRRAQSLGRASRGPWSSTTPPPSLSSHTARWEQANIAGQSYPHDSQGEQKKKKQKEKDYDDA